MLFLWTVSEMCFYKSLLALNVKVIVFQGLLYFNISVAPSHTDQFADTPCSEVTAFQEDKNPE